MQVQEILETAQFVVDQRGQRTAVLLDLQTWYALQQLMEEMLEDENLGKLMTAVQEDEKFTGNAAQEAYIAYLEEPQA